jgi:hypothetical protein
MAAQKADRERMFGHRLIFGVKTPKAESTYDGHYRHFEPTDPQQVNTIDAVKLNELHLSTRINYIQDSWSKSECIHRTFNANESAQCQKQPIKLQSYAVGKKKCILSPSVIAQTQDYFH